MRGARTDGHRYIQEAWEQGVRNFLVHDNIDLSSLPDANYILVPNVIAAFQKIASFHRQQYNGKVIAIIGSNGKTWVKEWLYMLMYRTLSVYRSPGSFNSQVGVPLSVWNIPTDSSYAIIEAGISNPGEMEHLEEIIRPDIVVFAHLGDAHDEGFGGDTHLKLKEKLLMCTNATSIVFPADVAIVSSTILSIFPDKYHFSCSTQKKGLINASTTKKGESTNTEYTIDGTSYSY